MKTLFVSKKRRLNKKGVFGLTSVQAFFAIILGVALLAYVIVVIMGTLSSSTLLPAASLSATVVNETGCDINATSGCFISETVRNVRGFTNAVIYDVINTTSNLSVNSGNYTFTSAGFLNGTKNSLAWKNVKLTYTHLYDSSTKNNAADILSNTSTGVTGFFTAINPVYAILAILVIILVLVVLVKVVTGGDMGSGRMAEPQL